jgi:hypothetical protein
MSWNITAFAAAPVVVTRPRWLPKHMVLDPQSTTANVAMFSAEYELEFFPSQTSLFWVRTMISFSMYVPVVQSSNYAVCIYFNMWIWTWSQVHADSVRPWRPSRGLVLISIQNSSLWLFIMLEYKWIVHLSLSA